MAGRGAVRPRLADPEPVRSAAHDAHRARGRARGDGERRRGAADRRFRRLCRPARPLRVPLRLHDEAAVPEGARGAEAGDLFRGRGRARAARDAGHPRGADRQAGADRPAGDHRGARQALRADDDAGRRFRGHRSAPRSALSRLCRGLSQGRGAQGRDARRRAHRGARLAVGDRRAGAASRRRRRADLRAGGALRIAAQAHPRHRRPRAGRQGLRRAVAGDRLERRLFPRRHARALRPQRRGDRRHGDRLRPSRAAIRRDAEDRADLAFRFRLGEHALGAEDARARSRCCANARPTSRRTARCRPTPRCR